MSQYDYDLFVIGAGSGGVRAGRMAAALGDTGEIQGRTAQKGYRFRLTFTLVAGCDLTVRLLALGSVPE